MPLKLGSLPDSLLPMKEDKDDPASLHSAGLYSVVCNGGLKVSGGFPIY